MYKEIVKKAIEAKKNSYSPYSHFKVGAALITKEGKIFTGCNIESASYSPTICAERVAVSKAISEGYNKIKAIAISGSSKETFPCGVCRQFLSEFGDMEIIVVKSENEYKSYKLSELLPYSFSNKDLIESKNKKDGK